MYIKNTKIQNLQEKLKTSYIHPDYSELNKTIRKDIRKNLRKYNTE